jgi:hypothetical protein
MNCNWELPIMYNLKLYKLNAVLEYKSKQIFRIRVQGTKQALLLQCDYPAIRFANSKKGIKWKLLKGYISETKDSPRLLLDIFQRLEHFIKRDFKEIFPEENLLF